MTNCPFCHLKHDPEKSHCNDPLTGALIRRAGPIATPGRVYTPVKLDLTPFGALQLLVGRVKAFTVLGEHSRLELDEAMGKAEEVLKRETLRLMQPLNDPPPTCVQWLEHARDSMDAADAELQGANKLASGMASLLLLDMIRETATMCARIRAILSAAKAAEVIVTMPGTSKELDCPAASIRGVNP